MARKSEMMDAIEALAKAKDISVDQIVSAVEEGCKAAYRRYLKRSANAPLNLSVVLSREHDVQIFARKVVSEEVEDENQQISLEDAKRLGPNYELGDIVEMDVTPADFGRVAAQTAKQVIRQRLQDVEKGKIYDEYIEKENEILTGIVERVDAKGVYVELGRTHGFLDASEFMPGEEYRPGDHIKVYVLQVYRANKDVARTPQVAVSRIHPGLVKRLFEMEVPEIATGVVQIKSIAREAGSRTKMQRAEKREDRHHQVVRRSRRIRGQRPEPRVCGAGAAIRRGKNLPRRGAGQPAVPGHRQGRPERPPRRQADRLENRHQVPDPV